MSSFLNHIEKNYGRGDRNRHANIFNALSMPNPIEEEWVEGLGCDMVFINLYGLVFKTFSKSGFNQFMKFGRNPFVLQPVKKIEFLNSCLIILPGISQKPIYSTEIDPVRFINSRLQELSIKSEDVREENIGFLPPTNGYSMPVLLDHGCTTGHEGLSFPFKNTYDYTKYPKNAFKELRQLMHQSWQGYSPKNSSALNTLLYYCKKHASMDIANPDKKLHSSWTEVSEDNQSDYKPLKVKKAAEKYNNRLLQKNTYP